MELAFKVLRGFKASRGFKSYQIPHKFMEYIDASSKFVGMRIIKLKE